MNNSKINWNEYFMGLAIFSSMRSKDTHTKVGACIVNEKKRVVGLGYNGMPNGCSDEELPWKYGETNLNTKYYYVVHAELNAIINAYQKDLAGCTLYTTLFPCCECTKAIIQSGIKEIVYYSDKYSENETTIASKMMLKMANVKITKYNSDQRKITLTL